MRAPNARMLSAMHLALFDIDGTLTTSDLDSVFVRVVGRYLNGAAIDTNWNRYPHATDSAIVTALLEEHAADPSQVPKIHDEYIDALQAEGGPVEQIVGAGRALDHLRAHGWAIAYATGNWNRAGTFKLQAAGLPAELPLAGADGIESREGILQDGVARARAAYDVPEFERVVYLGDASWDVRTARALSMPLVGIGDPVAPLREMGVSHVLPDYGNLDDLLDAVQHARVPSVP